MFCGSVPLNISRVYLRNMGEWLMLSSLIEMGICDFVVFMKLSMFNKTKNRGLAFVTMGSEEEAITALNNLELFVRVRRASDRSVVRADVDKEDESVTDGGEDVNVLEAELVYQRDTKKPVGFRFVSFGSREDARVAISALKGKVVLDS
ncbi:hypothetical protein GIB67_028329 [Kingdonia uniflora]|uniref:RRM domain-containing protein n=1 Tax=Kingdonia uniflora TaxID=39325 RepID=A0A7J7MHT9_9MAGN|nr:hypothetical protein GIB67_028329 [Kingdonia uniflora]